MLRAEELSLNVATVHNGDLDGVTQFEHISFTDLPGYLEEKYGPDVPQDEVARGLTHRVLDSVVQLASTNAECVSHAQSKALRPPNLFPGLSSLPAEQSEDSVLPEIVGYGKSHDRGIIRGLLRGLLLPMLPAVDEMLQSGLLLGDWIKPRLLEVENTPPHEVATDLLYAHNVYDLSSYVVAMVLDIPHPASQHKRFAELASKATPADRTLWQPSKSSAWRDALLSEHINDAERAHGFAQLSTAQVYLDRSVSFANNFQAIFLKRELRTRDNCNVLADHIEQQLSGKLMAEWAALHQFLLFGPRDGVHQQQFRSPAKEDAKVVAKIASMIKNFADYHDTEDPDASPAQFVSKMVAAELQALEMVRKLTHVKPEEIRTPRQLVITTRIDWLKKNYGQLVSSGLLATLPVDARQWFKQELPAILEEVVIPPYGKQLKRS